MRAYPDRVGGTFSRPYGLWAGDYWPPFLAFNLRFQPSSEHLGDRPDVWNEATGGLRPQWPHRSHILTDEYK